MKKKLLSVIVFTGMVFTMTSCSDNDNTKPQTHDFNPESNIVHTLQGVSCEVPSNWIFEIGGDTNNIYYYSPSDSSDSVFSFARFDDGSIAGEDYINEQVAIWEEYIPEEEYSVSDITQMTIGSSEITAYSYKELHESNGIVDTGASIIFNYDNALYTFHYTDSGECEYSISDDFEDIIDSIKVQ